MQQPGYGDLRRGGPQPLAERGEEAAVPAQVARRQGEPGDEPDALALALLDDILRSSVHQVVPVLHGRDRDDGSGRPDLVDADVGEPDEADLALALESGQLADLLLERDLGIDAVELEERDLLQPQPAEAHLALLAQVLGPAQRVPEVGPGAHHPGLGGDHELAGIGVEGGPDQLLADVGAVRVGGVDQVDTQLDGASQHRDGLVPVGGLSPDPGPGDPHGAKPEAMHHQLPTEGKRTAGACRSFDGRIHRLNLPSVRSKLTPPGRLNADTATSEPRSHPRERLGAGCRNCAVA